MLKRSFKKNIMTPKKLRTPYALFIKQNFATKKSMMSADAKLTDISQELAKDWANMSDKSKAKYHKAVEFDQTRFDA